MVTVLKGVSILLLLSIFFAYVLIPTVDVLRRRLRFGRRQRPVPIGVIIVALYLVMFAAGSLLWSFWGGRIRYVVDVLAPAAIEHLFSSSDIGPLDALLAKMPGPESTREMVTNGATRLIEYIEREVRITFDELLAASRYARWLVVVPLGAFFLITTAPGFRRSAERLLPHGHLQWRSGEYFRDVNSALAGYVRAQLAAGLIVGAECVAGFALLGLPSSIAMGIAAGALELVPALGPIATLLMATSQAGDRALAVAAFLGYVRLAQDYFIYPRLIRRGMHLATPVVVVAIWCGAALAGATGVILAIPVAGFLSVSIRHWREYRAIEHVVRDHARRQHGP
jgi:predicted PurR-regulated permease PerM